MRKLTFAVLCLGAYFAHAKYVFSNTGMNQWLQDANLRATKGEASACDDYADDVKVTLSSKSPMAGNNLEGNKEDICGYIKQTAKMMKLMRANTKTEISDLQIKMSGFPWLTAKVTYQENITMSVGGLPGMDYRSQVDLTLVRTLQGLKIKSLEQTTDSR